MAKWIFDKDINLGVYIKLDPTFGRIITTLSKGEGDRNAPFRFCRKEPQSFLAANVYYFSRQGKMDPKDDSVIIGAVSSVSKGSAEQNNKK